MEYTESSRVTEIKRTAFPTYGQTVSGYGPKIPTSAMVRYDGRWHRVYVMVYSNSGTAYIVKGGKNLILDTTTEHAISAR